MQADTRSRIWIATIPWYDAVPPTEQDVPHLHQEYSSSVYSSETESLSTLYKFPNALRASTISVAYESKFLVLKTAKPTTIRSFNELPGEWRHSVGTVCDTPPTNSVRTPEDGGICDIIDIDGDTAPFDCNACVARCKRIRLEITTLDDELAIMTKRIRTYLEDLLDL